jgi:hypothetical protein
MSGDTVQAMTQSGRDVEVRYVPSESVKLLWTMVYEDVKARVIGSGIKFNGVVDREVQELVTRMNYDETIRFFGAFSLHSNDVPEKVAEYATRVADEVISKEKEKERKGAV